MIISKTPFRVSLFGGGTDYPDWYLKHGGSVIGTTIDKYNYLSVRYLPPFFEHKHRIVWSNIELINEVDEIEHPAVKAILSDMEIERGMEISYNADLPARSGLGSSSSFTVGLLNALNALKGRMVSKKELADEAIRIEQKVIKEAVGSQDQIWAAHGGLNRIDFHQDGSYEVAPLIMPSVNRRVLQSSFMLFFTGFSRFASTIAEKQIANFNNKQKDLQQLGAFCDEAAGILQNGNSLISDLGRLMHEAWLLKRELADGVTTPVVNEIYNAGLEAGALGGKLLGAGGGGFMLFLVNPENKKAVREKLSNLIHVNFEFDTGGSKIVVFEPDGKNKNV